MNKHLSMQTTKETTLVKTIYTDKVDGVDPDTDDRVDNYIIVYNDDDDYDYYYYSDPHDGIIVIISIFWILT